MVEQLLASAAMSVKTVCVLCKEEKSCEKSFSNIFDLQVLYDAGAIDEAALRLGDPVAWCSYKSNSTAFAEGVLAGSCRQASVQVREEGRRLAAEALQLWRTARPSTTTTSNTTTLAASKTPPERLYSDGYVVLPGLAASVLKDLQRYASALNYSSMNELQSQPDGMRRLHEVPLEHELFKILSDDAKEWMYNLLGQACPVFKPTFLATAPGAADQGAHMDLPAPGAYSILIAVQPRAVYFENVGRVSLSHGGDVLIFSADLCHHGVGRSFKAKGTAFGVHMYAGRGINPAWLKNTYGCAV